MVPKFKKLLVTTIPGSDFDETCSETFLSSFEERMKHEHGVEVETFSVRELIYDFARQEHAPLIPHRIQRSSDEKVRLLRRLAFTHLEKHLSQKGENASEITVIHTSATSYSDQGKEESLSRRYLTEINPDLFVVVIDDPVAIFRRIPKREEVNKYAYLKIDDVVRWIENEVAEMLELAQDLDSRLFVVPRRQVSALIDLVMTDKKPAYVSYAMTQASDEAKARTKTLVSKLKSHFVVFDPACMGSAHADARMTDEELNFYRDDVKKRDEQWFIGINSEYTIVYLPEPVPAHGSQRELDIASELGKTVWVVLEPGYSDDLGRLTPFIDQPSDIVFISSEEFEFFLDLSSEEQSVYSSITKTMWGFKRRSGLSPLTSKENISDGLKIGEDEVSLEFIQEASKTFHQQVARGIVNPIGEKRLLELARASWDFNRPVWEDKASLADVMPLFREVAPPSEEVVPLAARTDTLRASQKHQAQMPTRIVESATRPSLKDEEVFTGIFGKYATSKNRGEWFEKLSEFFRQNDLGSFADRIEFMRFLKETLDKHQYRSPRIFEAPNLKKWFSEFDGGKSEGTKL
jgi:adenylate kinase